MWWMEMNGQMDPQRQLVRRKPYFSKSSDRKGVPIPTPSCACSSEAQRREPVVGVSMALCVRTRQMWKISCSMYGCG
jgi:hypothetical protein